MSGTDHDRAPVCESSSNPRPDRMSLGKREACVRDPDMVRSVRRCETEAV